MMYILFVFIILVLLLTVVRYSPIMSVGIFILLPLLVTYQWFYLPKQELFVYVKFYSVVIGVYLIEICRLTRLGKHALFITIPGYVLAINIVEAVIKDVSQLALPNLLNAAAGIFLCAGFAFFGNIAVRNNGKITDVIWNKMGLLWIFSYTLWNWTFIYLNFPANAGIHLAVLAAPLFICLADPERWGQTRAHSLGLYLIGRFLLDAYIPADFFNAAHWQNETSRMLLAASSCVTALMCLLLLIGKKYNASQTTQ